MNDSITNLEELIQHHYSNIAGIVIAKSERLIYEKYFDGYTKDDELHIASVTKSVMSVLIGIAVERGYIHSIDQNVLEYFPTYKTKRGEKTIQKVTIRDLLTMTAPYKYKSEPYTKVYSSEDWVKAALDLLGGNNEIGQFKYSTVGIHILSGIVTNATGQALIDFARENLFDPLHIKAPKQVFIHNKEDYLAFLKNKYVSGWIADPNGVNTAGWGLSLTPRDMVKIGQLYLHDGIWNGQHIVSPHWIEESTKTHSSFNNLSYGYLWWIVNDGYAALGDGGNVIYVNTKKRIVISIASRFMPRAKDRIELIEKQILPLFAH